MGCIIGCRMGQYILIIGHIVTSLQSNTATQKLMESGIRNANSGCRAEVWDPNTAAAKLGNSGTKRAILQRGDQ